MTANSLVQADTQALRDVLGAIVNTVMQAGGQLHPGIRFVATDGKLSVHCRPELGPPDQPLIRLPRELLVPIDGIEWADREDTLQVLSSLEHLSLVQRDLLVLHLALYNAASKLPWAVSHLPALAAPAHAPLLAAVQAIRPNFGKSRPQAASAFIQTRVFKLDESRVLMPLIDLLNHHPRGAAFQTDATAMTVMGAQPLGAGECFARYGGRRDVLDLALHYGYADADTPFAFCAPLVCSVPTLGSLTITGQRMRNSHPLDPPLITFGEADLTLSHLACHRQHPQRLRAALRLAVLGAARRQGLSGADAEQVVMHAFEALREINLALLQALKGAARPLELGEPVAAMLSLAATLQADILREVLTLPVP